MMNSALFVNFFQGQGLFFLTSTVRAALHEDGTDLTSNAVFPPSATLEATIVAKEDSIVAGAAFFPLILQETANLEPGKYSLTLHAQDGDKVTKGSVIATITGSARIVMRAERILLNFLCHLSGVANLVNKYAAELAGTNVQLLDTRKTLPGLRYPEKYAVLLGGGANHRLSLTDMLMLKDNHIDAAGGITPAVTILRASYTDIPIEVECRTLAEVQETVGLAVNRIMLDNMLTKELQAALAIIPLSLEVEISGNVTLETIRALALTEAPRKPNFISVGRLTHSAPAADFSMYITNPYH